MIPPPGCLISGGPALFDSSLRACLAEFLIFLPLLPSTFHVCSPTKIHELRPLIFNFELYPHDILKKHFCFHKI